MTTADIQTAVHSARKIDAATHHDLWGRVMASRDAQRKLVDPNAHRHTFKTLIEATCTDCCCKECICFDVADWNSEVLNDESFEALRSHSHDF